MISILMEPCSVVLVVEMAAAKSDIIEEKCYFEAGLCYDNFFSSCILDFLLLACHTKEKLLPRDTFVGHFIGCVCQVPFEFPAKTPSN